MSRPTVAAHAAGRIPADDAPLASALRAHAASIQAAELARARRRLGTLDAAQQEALAELLGAIAAGLIAAPMDALANDGSGDLDEVTVRGVLGLY